MKRKNKGITLIALVITIIILLILAAITINLTIGQRGILNMAKEAGRNYQEAAKKEEEDLAKFLGEAENIIQGTTPTPPEGGETTDPVIPTQPEPSEEVKALKAGDYIKYDTGVTTVGENGVITCRVLYPVDSEYGLQIISNKNIGTTIKLGGSTWEEGKTAYNGAIETLNNEAEKYVNKEYAYDARCVGSVPTVQNGMFVNKNKIRDSEGNINDALITVTIPESWTMPTGWVSRDTGCFTQDESYTIDETALKEVNGWITGSWYGLASRAVFSYSLGREMSIYIVMSDGTVSKQKMCKVENDGSVSGESHSFGLRPCISLKAGNIKITGGDGTSEATAYTLGI